MNTGSRIRTALAVVAVINQALITIGPVDFGNEISNQIYRWISLFFLVGAVSAGVWYNNDFTPVAAKHTGAMRLEKKGAEQTGIPLEEIEELDPLEDGDDE